MSFISTPELARRIRAIADDLMEARRYVRSNIAGTQSQVEQCIDKFSAVETVDLDAASRLTDNLDVALEFIQVDSTWAGSAIYATAAELRLMASRLERGNA